MKIKELIEKLGKFDPELEIKVNAKYTVHYCGDDGYCYCSCEDHIKDINDPILVESLRIYGKEHKKSPAVVLVIEEY